MLLSHTAELHRHRITTPLADGPLLALLARGVHLLGGAAQQRGPNRHQQ